MKQWPPVKNTCKYGVTGCDPRGGPYCTYASFWNPKFKHSKCVVPPSKKEFCRCKPGYFGRAGVQGCLPAQGGQCFSDDNCPHYSLCENMKCKCKNGYVGNGITCKPDCFETSDCPDKHARCVNGKCLCRKGTQEDGRMCKPECQYFFDCLQFSECKSGMCRCKEELLGNGETCYPAPRHKCSSDKDCHSKAKCQGGECVCQGTSIGNGRFCRRRHTCPSNHTCGANTMCIRDPYFLYHFECRCLPGYFKDEEENCVDCLSNEECPAYSSCYKGKCNCRDELVGDGKRCKPAPLHKCIDDNDCFSKATCYYGRCMCEGNATGNGLYCRNSLPCPQNNACGEHSICVVDPLFPNVTDCKCVMGYEKSRQGNCVELNECVKRGLDCPENSTCNSQKPESYTCICDEGFRKAVHGEDIICEDVDECSTGKAKCSGDRCINSIGSFHCVPCPRGFSNGKDGKCVDHNRLSNNRRCNCKRHEECLKGKCKCKKGYKKSKQGNCVRAHNSGANPKENGNSDFLPLSSVSIHVVGFLGCLAFTT